MHIPKYLIDRGLSIEFHVLQFLFVESRAWDDLEKGFFVLRKSNWGQKMDDVT